MGWLGRRMPQVIAAIVVFGMAGLILQSSLKVDVSDRALSTFDTQDVSRNARENENSQDMIPFVLSHPLGVGTGTMSALSSYKVWGSGNVPFAIQGGLIHNNLLMIAIETGWLGTAMFIWLLVALAISAVNNYRTVRDPYLKALSLALCGFVAFYLGMQVLAPMLMQPLVSYIAFALFALLVIVPDLDARSAIGEPGTAELAYARSM
jgi:hypothetical protein